MKLNIATPLLLSLLSNCVFAQRGARKLRARQLEPATRSPKKTKGPEPTKTPKATKSPKATEPEFTEADCYFNDLLSANDLATEPELTEEDSDFNDSLSENGGFTCPGWGLNEWLAPTTMYFSPQTSTTCGELVNECMDDCGDDISLATCCARVSTCHDCPTPTFEEDVPCVECLWYDWLVPQGSYLSPAVQVFYEEMVVSDLTIFEEMVVSDLTDLSLEDYAVFDVPEVCGEPFQPTCPGWEEEDLLALPGVEYPYSAVETCGDLLELCLSECQFPIDMCCDKVSSCYECGDLDLLIVSYYDVAISCPVDEDVIDVTLDEIDLIGEFDPNPYNPTIGIIELEDEIPPICSLGPV